MQSNRITHVPFLIPTCVFASCIAEAKAAEAAASGYSSQPNPSHVYMPPVSLIECGCK